MLKERVETKIEIDLYQVHWKVRNNINFKARFDMNKDWPRKFHMVRSCKTLNHLSNGSRITIILEFIVKIIANF